ncbi:NUDIX domain-containing protein [Spirosoma soli]|uniref:NUDIX domain-containing protein n=1 Tax=Spirosoma soli TaxID=1770529 RepID=A0ABW5MBU7_9BACT
MNSERSPARFVLDGHELLPGISIDPVIFGFHEGQLKILLLEFRDTRLFALPGGFVHETENLDEAARRILADRTGLRDIYLEQFYVFGDRDRRDAETQRKIMVSTGTQLDDDHWLLRRFISIGYYALIDFTQATPTPDALSDSCTWYDLAELPPLIFDHSAIVRKALDTLQKNLDDKLVGLNLLPETFTMADLQRLYETILARPLQRTNFQRKMLSLGILERLEKKMSGGAHKAPYLYRFISPTTP